MNTTWLHVVGDVIRESLKAVPLPGVRVLFVGLYVALLAGVGVWAWRQRKTPGNRIREGLESSLRWWHLGLLALAAIILQGVVYSVL